MYTTVDRKLQLAATKAIRDTLPYRDDPASALVSIDPRTGAIKAMTAVTPMRRKNQFNLVSQMKRQAGSTFKTFVLTTAVLRGVNPDTTYYTSAPFKYQPDPLSKPWEVETYSKSYLGTTSISSATLSSDNTVYAQLMLDLGPEEVAKTARRMGVTVPANEVVPAMGLGAISVSPLEMAGAYATLAAGGVYSRPMAIRRVVLPGGEEDTEAGWGKPRRRRVLPDWVAYEVTKILEQNIQAAPAPVRRSGGPRPERPGRPTTTPTPGSRATRRTCRRPSGSATRVRRSRWRTCTGSPSPAAPSRGHLAAFHARRDRAAAVPRLDAADDEPRLDAVRDRPVRARLHVQRRRVLRFVRRNVGAEQACAASRGAAPAPAEPPPATPPPAEPPPPPPPVEPVTPTP